MKHLKNILSSIKLSLTPDAQHRNVFPEVPITFTSNEGSGPFAKLFR